MDTQELTTKEITK